MVPIRLALPVAAILALAARPTAQAVHEVGGPAPDFTVLQDAIDAAADGDVILVHPGVHPAMVIDGKGLTVQATEPGMAIVDAPEVTDRIEVRNVPASSSVRLRGLQFLENGIPGGFGGLSNGPPSLTLVGCAGTIWIEECIGSRSSPGAGGYSTGLHVEDSSSVVVVDCTFQGSGSACGSLPPNKPGLLVTGASRVHAFDSTFRGGRGGTYGSPSSGLCETPDEGCDGIEVLSPESFLFLSGCRGVGARGAEYDVGSGCRAFFGGVGLRNHAGTVWALDTTFETPEPGPYDAGWYTCIQLGGTPETVGPHQRVPGSSLRFRATSPVSQGETVALTFEGPRFAPVFLAVDTSSTSNFSELLGGTYLLTVNAEFAFAGITDADGRLELAGPAPFVPGASFTTFAQPLWIDLNAGTPAPGPPSRLGFLGGALRIGSGSMTVGLGD